MSKNIVLYKSLYYIISNCYRQDFSALFVSIFDFTPKGFGRIEPEEGPT